MLKAERSEAVQHPVYNGFYIFRISLLVISTLFQTIKDKELVSRYLKSHTVLTNAYKETEALDGYKLYQLSETEFREIKERRLN